MQIREEVAISGKSITCILARQMQYTWQDNDEKEGTIMKTTIARKTAYVGAGAGLVLFALFGLLPGSILGGAMGLNIAGWLFGLPLEPGTYLEGHRSGRHARRGPGCRHRYRNGKHDDRMAPGQASGRFGP